MLPHVHPENGHLTAHDGILILGDDDAQPSILLRSSRLLDKPTPTTALDAQEGSVEGLLETLKAAPRLLDLGRQRRGRLRVAGLGSLSGGQVLPEERVVDVPSAVELDGGLLGDLGGDVVGGDGGDVGLQGVVEVGHVGLVVLAVVKLHDLGRDVRLQSIVGIWQLGKRVSRELSGHGGGCVSCHCGLERSLRGKKVLPEIS